MVAAGPNTSVSCTAPARRHPRPASASAPRTPIFAGSMPSIVGARRRRRSARSRPSRCQAPDALERRGLLAARHHRTHAGVGLVRGSPSLVFFSRASKRFGNRIGADPAGAKMRRIAVHFCPAFTVISRHDLLDEGIEGRAAGARARRKQRRIDAVGLDIHRHALAPRIFGCRGRAARYRTSR